MKIIQKPSTNFSQRPEGEIINSIVLHYTGMESEESAIAKMRDSNFEVSCHYVVNQAGEIIQLVDEKMKAWHAGLSNWRGKDNINTNSIGIEIINKGHEFGYEEFPQKQISSVIDLCKFIKNNNPIDDNFITGHSDIAPNRKEDPGELFPWELLAENNIGLYLSAKEKDEITAGSPAYDTYIFTTKEIIQAKILLHEIGYFVHPSDSLDEQFKKVLIAFYRRFFPERILIQQNTRYPDDIHLDGKAIKLIEAVAEIYK